MAGPFTGIQDIYNSIVTLGQVDTSVVGKTALNNTTAAAWCSGWAIAGLPPAGATDSGGTQYVMGVSGGSGASANKGGLVFGYPAISPQQRYLISYGSASSVAATIILADRLCAIGPITISSTGSKTLTTLPALPRYTNGIGVEAWLEVTTTFATTAPVFYLDSYTGTNNSAGTSAGSTVTLTSPLATMAVSSMFGPFPLLTPDVGIKAVASFNVSTAAASGAVNFVLLRRLATFSVSAVTGGDASSISLISQIPALQNIPDGACLFPMVHGQGAVNPAIAAEVVTAYK